MNISQACLNSDCKCHTDPADRVRTPFPISETDDPYCCNRCAPSRALFAYAVAELQSDKLPA